MDIPKETPSPSGDPTFGTILQMKLVKVLENQEPPVVNQKEYPASRITTREPRKTGTHRKRMEMKFRG